MAPGGGEDELSAEALAACASLLAGRLAAVAPGLLDEYPLAHSAALIDRLLGVRGAGYSHLGEYPEVAGVLERRAGRAGVAVYHRLLLLHFMRRGMAQSSLLRLPASVAALRAAEWRRILGDIDAAQLGSRDPDDFYQLDNDLFLKDLGLVRGVLLPVGAELVEVGSGMPRRVLTMGGPRQLIAGLAFFLSRVGGFRPLLELHMDPRNLREFNPEGWDRTYRRLAELLELNPDVKGVFGGAWFNDPAMEWVSPHLAYIRLQRVTTGARVFRGPEAASHARAGALATSATRRRLYEEGRYRPRIFYPVWSRRDLLRWASRRGEDR